MARRLVRESIPIRLFVRDPSRLDPDLARIETVSGDLRDRDIVLRAADGVGSVIHGAALTRASRARQFYEVNRDGTATLMRAIEDRSPSCRIFVLISSLAAAGPSAGGEVMDESSPPCPVSHYGRSKLEAENVLAGESEIPWTALRLSAVYGPGDREIFPFFRAAARGVVPLPASPGSRIQMLYVDDAVDAILRALTAPPAGRLCIAHPEVLTYRNLLERIGDALDRKVRIIPIPKLLVRLAAVINGLAAAATGRSAIFNPGKARELLAPAWLCRVKRAGNVLQFQAAVDFSSGSRMTVDWYRDKRWLP